MGLLYVFPISKEETDFVVEKDHTLTLKTYGLPYIFWIYAFCVISVIAFMFLAVRPPVLKLVTLGDELDATLGYSFLTFIGSLPVIILAFFFYEKRIVRSQKTLSIEHRVFGLPLFTEKITFTPQTLLTVESFISSPNLARMRNNDESLGFQNKGYFVLWLQNEGGKKIRLDRHSRKIDLDKLKNLLENQN